MTTEGVSTYDAGPRPKSFEGDYNSYSAGQALASVLNNPQAGKSWGSWFVQASDSLSLDPPPVPSSTILPEIDHKDFARYLHTIGRKYVAYVAAKQDVLNDKNARSSLTIEKGTLHHRPHRGGAHSASREASGEGLVVCMQEIPALYFSASFHLGNPDTFQAVCPPGVSSPELQHKLSHYLDIVETHLLREISARSDSFFEALGVIQELGDCVTITCSQIEHLRRVVGKLEDRLLDSALALQRLWQRRRNLLALHHKLRVVVNVAHAQQALQLLLPAADFAGALDVIDDINKILANNELEGLHCFRHTEEHMTATADAVNRMMEADFLRFAQHRPVGAATATSLARQHYASRGVEPPAALSNAAAAPKEKLDEEYEGAEGAEEEALCVEQMLPLVMGLLRTGKLVGVLRKYRSGLVSEVRGAIKRAVGELLPLLFHPSTLPDADGTEGGGGAGADGGSGLREGAGGGDDGAGLATSEKLRALPPEEFIALLHAVASIVQGLLAHALSVHRMIEDILQAFALGASGKLSEAPAVADDGSAADEEGAEATSGAGDGRGAGAGGSAFGAAGSSGLLWARGMVDSVHTVKAHRLEVLKESLEVVVAATEAAHARWAKLMSVRAKVHTRLRREDFTRVFGATQRFIDASEELGGRKCFTLRGTLQTQAKAYFDDLHQAKVSMLALVLERELWTPAEVAPEFQRILDLFYDPSGVYLGGDSASSGGAAATVGRGDDVGAGASNEGSAAASSASAASTAGHDRVADAGSGDGTASTANGLEDSPAREPRESSEGREGGDDAAVSSMESLEGSGKSTSKSPGDAGQEDADGSKAGGDGGGARKPVTYLVAAGVKFNVVQSSLILLKVLSEYLEIAICLPVLASEAIHRMSEILRLFNQRSCQLVLGAGAMQVRALVTSMHGQGWACRCVDMQVCALA
eukprot:jgi/Mesvir1/24637/Mv21946-RA.1